MSINSSSIIDQKQLLIAGPCSVETREQLLSTARELAKSNQVGMLRAGIWKPRTAPNGFEGIGTKGLTWLAEAKQETGLPISTEVATPKHVEDALHFGVDVLWIGARTSVNPFSVQAIADALRGTQIPVLIKNPVNPDMNLWAGAIERLAAASIKHIGLIHRGFSTYDNGVYRNNPLWQIPIQLRRHYPELPLFCDPSHIGGTTELIPAIAQHALDLDYSGLMIETHIDPSSAWTDRAQQLTPEALEQLIYSLNWKTTTGSTKQFNQHLIEYREEINQIDDQLINLLASRMQFAQRIGNLKEQHGVTILQEDRWNAIMNRLILQGKQKQLNATFIEELMDLVHHESIRLQGQTIPS